MNADFELRILELGLRSNEEFVGACHPERTRRDLLVSVRDGQISQLANAGGQNVQKCAKVFIFSERVCRSEHSSDFEHSAKQCDCYHADCAKLCRIVHFQDAIVQKCTIGQKCTIANSHDMASEPSLGTRDRIFDFGVLIFDCGDWEADRLERTGGGRVSRRAVARIAQAGRTALFARRLIGDSPSTWLHAQLEVLRVFVVKNWSSVNAPKCPRMPQQLKKSQA